MWHYRNHGIVRAVGAALLAITWLLVQSTAAAAPGDPSVDERLIGKQQCTLHRQYFIKASYAQCQHLDTVSIGLQHVLHPAQLTLDNLTSPSCMLGSSAALCRLVGGNICEGAAAAGHSR
jgi:hypothetical protein